MYDIKNIQILNFSPCSGLIVSVLSKRQKGEHIDKLKTYLNQVITPYKKFKKMYVVENLTQEFKGKIRNVFYQKMKYFIKSMILLN